MATFRTRALSRMLSIRSLGVWLTRGRAVLGAGVLEEEGFKDMARIVIGVPCLHGWLSWRHESGCLRLFQRFILGEQFGRQKTQSRNCGVSPRPRHAPLSPELSVVSR